MYLGIDGQRLAGQRLGVGRYIEYLLRHWGALRQPGDRIDLFLRGGGPHHVAAIEGIRQVPLRPALSGQLWQNLVLGPHVRGLDVLFCPAYMAPITRPGPCVVALHSVEDAEPGSQPWYHRYTYSAIHRASARRAARVIAPSLSVSEEIQELYGLAPDRIVVIPQGADECFRPNADPAVRSAAQKRLVGAERPYLLFVGKLSRRRNIPLLIETMATLVHEDRIPHALLLLGPNHLDLPIAEQAASLGIADRIVQNDGRFSDHRELVSAYVGADLYVSASSYEGFSMTMVEAMSCGTPIVAMRRGALPEIAGDAAVLVPEVSSGALAEAIRRVLGDGTLREALRRKSLARAEAFRWPDIAGRTLDVLREAAAA